LRTSNCSLLLIYLPRKDERLSRPGWLTYSGRFTGDHLSGKPGNVREFDSCQGNVRDFTTNQGIVREKLPKTVDCKLHICVHTGI